MFAEPHNSPQRTEILERQLDEAEKRIAELVKELHFLRQSAGKRIEELEAALAIFIHAHSTGNNVPPHIEAQARAALRAGKEAGR